MEKLDAVIFYTLDKAIRTYRQYAQKELKKAGFDITIDQWLILKTILENPEISQQELSEMVFKDTASVTRIIELLVKAQYLERQESKEDRRRTRLKLTAGASKVIQNVQKIVSKNRVKALNGLPETTIAQMRKGLQKIIGNLEAENK